MDSSYEQLDALRAEKREAKSKMMELKEKIKTLKIVLDQKKRLKKLPEFLFETYVSSGRLTAFHHPCRTDYITITLDNDTHEWYAQDGPPFYAVEEIERLVRNKEGEFLENAVWWSKVQSVIQAQNREKNAEVMALLCVYYYRCEDDHRERCC